MVSYGSLGSDVGVMAYSLQSLVSRAATLVISRIIIMVEQDNCLLNLPIISIAAPGFQNGRVLTVKGLDIYLLPLTGKPEQQWFTMRGGVLTSISSRQRSAINGRPLPERTDFGPAVCSYNRPAYAPDSHTMAFTPQCSLATTRYF